MPKFEADAKVFTGPLSDLKLLWEGTLEVEALSHLQVSSVARATLTEAHKGAARGGSLAIQITAHRLLDAPEPEETPADEAIAEPELEEIPA